MDAPAASGFEVVVGGRTMRHPPYRVRKCNVCGLHYKSDRLNDEQLGDYYSQLEYESFESDTLMPPDKLIVDAQAGLPPGSRILDFGCGVGRTLARSVAERKCFGVEPNARAAAVASQRGITVIADSELDASYAGFFDMVVLSDVYEHLPHPMDTLLRLRRCLKPGGTLLLVTGFADGVNPRELLSEHWYFRVPGHLHMAGSRHLEWIATQGRLRLGRQVALCHYRPSFVQDLMQRARLWAYAATRLSPAGMQARMVRALPVLKRAALWNNAPVMTCAKDHVFASFIKTES